MGVAANPVEGTAALTPRRAATADGRLRSVLIVSYHFLPVHNVAVRQLVGYCRYLPEFGWRPIVLSRDWTSQTFTARDRGEGLSFEPALSATLGQDTRIVQVPRPASVRRFVRLQRTLQRWSAATRRGPVVAAASLVRMAVSQAAPLFGHFPDELVEWAPGAVAAGLRIVKDEGVAAIVSSCPPATNHVVGSEIARGSGLPWFPHFGDLYSFQVTPSAATRTPLQRAIARRRNSRWMRPAVRTFAVSPGMTRYLESVYGPPGDVVVVGFDESDFAVQTPVASPKFTISHTGSLYVDQRPELFLDALDALLTRRPEIASAVSVRFVGSKQEARLRAMLASRPCGAVVSVEEKVSPAEAIALQRSSDVLLLFPVMADWNRSALGTFSYPSKIFEYFGAERRILSVPGDGDWTDRLLETTRTGFSLSTAEEGAALLGDWFDEWRRDGGLAWNGRRDAIARFSHRAQAELIAGRLDEASGR